MMDKPNELAEKIKQSELHNLNNKFSVGYEAMSNMKTRVSTILLPSVPDHMRVNTQPGSREIVETQVLKNCLVSYFNIVRKHINDLVPKTIMAFLVNKTKDTAQQILYKKLYEEKDVMQLMGEDPLIEQS